MRRQLQLLLLACLGILLSILFGFSLGDFAIASFPPREAASVVQRPSAAAIAQRAAELYQAGRFSESAEQWQAAIAASEGINRAIAFSNLSLVYQEMSRWDNATSAIQQSFEQLGIDRQSDISPINLSAVEQKALAEILDIDGQLRYRLGQPDQALISWQHAAELYQQTPDIESLIQNLLNQVQALQLQGQYMQSKQVLAKVEEMIGQTDNNLQDQFQLYLGKTQRLIGDFDDAIQTLQSASSHRKDSPFNSDVLLELGNTYRAICDKNSALDSSSAISQASDDLLLLPEGAKNACDAAKIAYEDAQEEADPVLDQTQIQLNLLNLIFGLLEQGKEDIDNHSLDKLVQEIDDNLQDAAQQPISRTHVVAQLNFASQLLQSQPLSSRYAALAETWIAKSIQDAQDLQDRFLYSSALGYWGLLDEVRVDYDSALASTQQALSLAQEQRIPELIYRWQWQAGRIYKAQGKAQNAIAAYSVAVDVLQSLRKDLIVLNPDVQFSFQKDVEPVYRELVDLLLSQENPDLEKARAVIDSLQLAEVENYLRQSCSTAQLEDIDRVIEQLDPSAAFLYTILLDDRLEVIIKLPESGKFLHHSVNQTKEQVRDKIYDLRYVVEGPVKPNNRDILLLTEVYHWLLADYDQTLQDLGIQTLVFVLDDVLRDLPIAALHDGTQYLIDKPYAVAITPGLQLLDPTPLNRVELSAVIAGQSDFHAYDGFGDLDGVIEEINGIQSIIRGQILLNESFTRDALQTAIATEPAPVLHLATHGKFGARIENTFIIAWDKKIGLRELGGILNIRDQVSENPVELTVLSACETLTGNGQASLGLAGFAVQSGTRSAIASLWVAGDNATAQLMQLFYTELANNQISKAEALRKAQVEMQRAYAPRYWANFVTIGNWL